MNQKVEPKAEPKIEITDKEETQKQEEPKEKSKKIEGLDAWRDNLKKKNARL